MIARGRILGLGLLAGVAVACSTDPATNGADAGAAMTVLPSNESHFGKTYAEWGSRWWQWLYEFPLDASCAMPDIDETGKSCAKNQSGDVYFLTGTRGNTSTREACVIPRGKAIFLPIINFSSDNGGVPVEKHLGEADIKATVESGVAAMSDVVLKLDGTAVDTTTLRVPVTKYAYTLPPEPNSYSCVGATGVVGPVAPAFQGGYYAMIAPPTPGMHEIEFGGRAPDFRVRVVYKLKVE